MNKPIRHASNTERPLVVITDFDFGDISIETEILEAAGADVLGLQAKNEADLAAVAPHCAAMMNQYARIGAETIQRMQRCKVIARYGVGVDIVDVDAATQKGILVTNVQNYCTEEVADHAITLWLTLARKIATFDRATHAGTWHWKSGQPIHRISERTMGIISFGKIGQAIASRARAFGVTTIAYDPYCPPSVAAELGTELVSKNELLARSDYVLMQAPMNKDTHHFLSEAEFNIMKPGAILVNTGRGPTVNNKALYNALTNGTLAAAGLDDPEEEPAKRSSWSPNENPLFTLPNVIITPHAAYYSEESIRSARIIAATQVAKVISGKIPDYSVNAHLLA